MTGGAAVGGSTGRGSFESCWVEAEQGVHGSGVAEKGLMEHRDEGQGGVGSGGQGLVTRETTGLSLESCFS